MLPETVRDDAQALNQCLRDIVALSTLPAIWSGADLLRIAESLAASLYTILAPEFVHVSISAGAGKPPIAVTQTDRYESDALLARKIGPAVVDWARAHDPDELLVLHDVEGFRRVRLSARSLGFHAEFGVIAAAFADANSPTAVQQLLLHVAANQATTAVQNAHLLQSSRESDERIGRANAELLQKQQTLNIALAASDTGTFRWDPSTGEFSEFDGNLKRLFGIAPDRTVRVTRDFIDRVHSEDRAKLIPAVEASCRDGADFSMEYRVVRPNGEVRWLYDRAKMERDLDGAPKCLVGACTDITERKQAEEALRVSEAFNKQIIESSPECIKVLDLGGKLLYMSDSGRRLLEISDLASYLNRSWPQLWRDGDREQALRAIDSAKAGGTGEFHGYCPTERGTPKWWHVIVTPIKGPDGQVERLLAVSRDITDQKRAEHALLEAAERFRFMAESMPQKIFTAKPNGDVDYFNPQWTEFTGLSFEQIKDWGWTQFVHPDDVAENVRVWRNSVDTGEPFRFEHRFRRADGEYRWHLSRAVPMGDDQGRIVMWVGSNTDIHEQRETANRLRQLANDLQDVDRRKDEFLAMLAHELRNPLAPISNALHIVRRHGDNAKTVQSALEIMERQVAQMIRLVDDLVDVSRMSSGKIGLRRERVELLSVVKHLAEATQSLAAKSNHELAVALPAEPIYVNADATRLSQALGNLLNNACKYTPAGGRIAVAVERVGVHAVVRVSDTGIGIAPENLPRIFEMFTQVDTSLERSQSGLGIGLTLARKLLEMHEGTLEARSAGVGKGSEFVVRLPVDLDAGQAMRSEADASRVGVADIIESSARGGSLRPVRQAH